MRPFEPLAYEELSERLQAALPPDASVGLRMAAANGNLPLITLDLVTCLYYLANDQENSIRRTARKSLRQLPPTIIETALKGNVSPKILNWFAHLQLDEPRFFELIVLNKNTVDETLAYLARTCEHLPAVEIIAKNELHLLKSPEIIEALENNDTAPISTVQRAIDFYRLQTGRSHTDFLAEKAARQAESEAEESAEDEEAAEPAEEGAEDTAPAEAEDDQADEDGEPEASAEEVEETAAETEQEPAVTPDGEELTEKQEALMEEGILESFTIEDLLKEDFDQDRIFAEEFLVDTEAQLDADTRESLANRIRKMKVINQMRLALKGNLEARNILIKSGNKLVQECVLRNPRITLEEILKLSKDKSAREELIRAVSLNREWTKSYAVIHTLCWNPKTPIQQTSKFLNRLTVKDLQTIARSKQVPGMLAVQARKLVEQKERYR